MGARRPQRPAPGHSMLLPRTGADPAGNTVQRAFDAVSTSVQQVQKTVAATQDAVTSASSGRWLATNKLTGTGSGMLNPATTRVRFRIVACGGGGGGAQGSGAGANGAAGAGGATGALLEGEQEVAPGGAYSWVAPTSGGAGGTAAGAAGTAGSDATLTLPTGTGPVTFIAKGGQGGEGMLGTPGDATSIGGTTPAGSSTGSTIIGAGAGDRGEDGIVKSGIGYAGMGGSIPGFGAGGTPGRPPSAGGAAQGFGAGGAGANATTIGQVGGDGAPAYIVLEERS